MRLTAFLIALLVINSSALAAESFSLRDALVISYETNPQIKQAIAELESTNNEITKAYGGFLPNIGAQVDLGRQRNAIGGTTFEYSDVNTQSLSVTQPLFQGGETLAEIEKANYQIRAERFNLQFIEQSVMLDTVNSYTAYITAEALLGVAESNYKLLSRQLELTEARFELGELTITDVAQAKARLAAIDAERISAQTALISSKSQFVQVVGIAPENLEFPKDLPPIPQSLEKSIELGSKFNPELQASIFMQKAADEDVDVKFAQILPEASLVGSMRRDKNSGFLNGNFDTDSITLQLSIPIFQSGSEYADIRQAKQTALAQSFAATDVERRVNQQIESAWQEANSAESSITANEAAVEAAQIAFDGITQEQEFGLRNVLDVLDSEQSLFDAKNNLLLAKRDQIIAYYSLLDKIGILTAQNLELPTKIYDSEQSYDDTKYQFIGY